MYANRRTHTDDLPQILDLIHEFHTESLDEYGLSCNDSVAKVVMPELVETSMVMVHEGRIVGVIAGFFTTHILAEEKLFQEVVWFVSKNHRTGGVKLLKDMEAWCRNEGAKHMIMVNMSGERDKVFEKFYESQGYKLLEVQYIREL